MLHATIVEPEPNDDIVLTIGYFATLVFVFVFISRILDVTIPYFRIPLILGLIYAGAAALKGRLLYLLKYPAGKALMGFFACMMISFPFSVWRGGSVETITNTVRALLMVAGIVALATTLDRTLKLMHAVGYAVVVASAMAYVLGGQVTGRLVLGDVGMLADPNMMAMACLVGLPFVVLKAKTTDSRFLSIAVYLAALAVLVTVARTGSRSGMLTIVVMTLVMFVRTGMQGKIGILLMVGVGVLLTPFLISDELKARYLTFFENEDEATKSAAQSTQARSYLFWRSVDLTLQHPILGVGPGMFPVAENEDSREEFGVRGVWHDTHNTYTQVSSENGIPALLLFLTALGWAWTVPNGILKTIPADATGELLTVRRAALAFELSVIAFIVNGAFLSLAYMGIPYTLIALSMAFYTTANRALVATIRAPGNINTFDSTPGLRQGQPRYAMGNARAPVARGNV